MVNISKMVLIEKLSSGSSEPSWDRFFLIILAAQTKINRTKIEPRI
jgi:hypothetical protein